MMRDSKSFVLLSSEVVEYHFMHDQNLTLSSKFNNSQTAREAKTTIKAPCETYLTQRTVILTDSLQP